MANFWKNKYNKTNKSTYDLSKEINVSEQKVKEIINGERQVPTRDIDRVNEAFSTKKKAKVSSFERALMEKFFLENDIQDLKKKFGYHSIKDLSQDMSLGIATLFRLRKDTIGGVSTNKLQKAYDWFQDEFNIKVPSARTKNSRENNTRLNPIKISRGALPQEVLDWYESTDIKEELQKRNLKIADLPRLLGFRQTYYGALNYIVNKKAERVTNNYVGVQQLYNYFNDLPLLEVYKDGGQIEYENKKSRAKCYVVKISKEELPTGVLNWYENTNLTKLRKSEGLTQAELTAELGLKPSYNSVVCAFENHRGETKSSNYFVVQQMYNYYHNLPLEQAYPNEPIRTEINEEPLEEVEKVVETLDKLVQAVEEPKNEYVEDSVPYDAFRRVEQKLYETTQELKRYKYLVDQLMKKDNYEN